MWPTVKVELYKENMERNRSGSRTLVKKINLRYI